MAAGLSLPQENVEPFRQKINEYAPLTDDDLVPKIHIDVPMPVDYVSMRLVSEFSVLARLERTIQSLFLQTKIYV